MFLNNVRTCNMYVPCYAWRLVIHIFHQFPLRHGLTCVMVVLGWYMVFLYICTIHIPVYSFSVCIYFNVLYASPFQNTKIIIISTAGHIVIRKQTSPDP
ncbi:hypothetical protein FKM82_021581 [Ascaphus truei]